jgi:hypothetical protein
MNKKFKIVLQKKDSKIEELIKFLIHDIAQKRYQKLVDKTVNEILSQPND